MEQNQLNTNGLPGQSTQPSEPFNKNPLDFVKDAEQQLEIEIWVTLRKADGGAKDPNMR